MFLDGESHGQRCLADYSPWGCKELDMTEHAHTHIMEKPEQTFWLTKLFFDITKTMLKIYVHI